MKSVITSGTTSTLLLGLSLLTIASQAEAKDCKDIHAQIISAQVTAGCTSPVGLCTAGTIDGNHGLSGTTNLVADSLAAGPGTAPDAPATISYSRVLQIAAEHETLTARDTGIFDTATPGTSPTSGLFSSFDRIDSGTGRYSGATGTFQIVGKTVKGKFVSELTGEVCPP